MYDLIALELILGLVAVGFVLIPKSHDDAVVKDETAVAAE